MDAFISSLRADDAGCKRYAKGRDTFRAAVVALGAGLQLRLAADDPANIDKAQKDIGAAGESIHETHHWLRQLGASWSESPVWDSQCIDFACNVCAPVCTQAHVMCGLATSAPDTYIPDIAICSAISKLADVETAKPMLIWLTDVEKASQIIADAKKLDAWLQRANDKYTAATLEIVDKLTNEIKSKLVEEPCDDDALVAGHSCSKLSQLRTLRQRCKAKVDALTLRKDLGTHERRHDLISTANEVLRACKHQTVRWGLLSFTKHTDIRCMTSAGADLRKKLGTLWSVHEKDERVLAYLGEATAKLLSEFTSKSFGKSPGEHSGAGAAKKTRRA